MLSPRHGNRKNQLAERSQPCSLFCTRVSSIEQQQHSDSRIFCFLASRAQPLALAVALAGVHQGSKTGIGVPISVFSVRFLLTLLNDFHGMGFYDRFAAETWASNTCWINRCSSGERTNANAGKLQGLSDSAVSCFFLFHRPGICSRPDQFANPASS